MAEILPTTREWKPCAAEQLVGRGRGKRRGQGTKNILGLFQVPIGAANRLLWLGKVSDLERSMWGGPTVGQKSSGLSSGSASSSTSEPPGPFIHFLTRSLVPSLPPSFKAYQTAEEGIHP